MLREKRDNQTILNVEYKDAFKKLMQMKKKEKFSLDYDLDDMTKNQLKQRKEELYKLLCNKYSKKLYFEYEKIAQELGDVYSKKYNKMYKFVFPQLNPDTEVYIRMLVGTLENERHVYQGFEEPYEFLKVELVNKLIHSLEEEATKNQDIVDAVIDYIKEEIKEMD